jgi:glycosyltransferase involved in cell wall biosynthesis
MYLKFCFNLSFIFSDYVILDNPYYYAFLPKMKNAQVKVLTYGGEIDFSLSVNEEITTKYPFINDEYFLSVSRSLEDNQLEELCACFAQLTQKLVLISNFSKSTYGSYVYNKYNKLPNLILIDGLYQKQELDLIRRKCRAYIHTHKLCGTAPSLVEMIIAQVPIISYDNPQNRYTLHNQGFFFSSFDSIHELVNNQTNLAHFVPTTDLAKGYNWNKIVTDYEGIL